MTDLNRESSLRQWAGRKIEVGPDADSTTARTRFLSLLEDADLVPDESSLLAYRLFDPEHAQTVEPRHLAEFRQDDERELLVEIDAFGHEMLDLPLHMRPDRWNRLFARSNDSQRARAWLEALSPGLKADLNQIDPHDADVCELARHLARLFPLRSHARAALRDEVENQLQDHPGNMPRAVRRLRARQPDIAALDPPLLTAITNSVHAQKALLKAKQRNAKQRFRTTRTSSNGQWWLIGLVLMVISIVGRLASLDRPSPPPPTYSPDFYQNKPLPGLDVDEIRAILEGVPERESPPESPNSLAPDANRQDEPPSENLTDPNEASQRIRTHIDQFLESNYGDERESAGVVAIPLPANLLEPESATEPTPQP